MWPAITNSCNILLLNYNKRVTRLRSLATYENYRLLLVGNSLRFKNWRAMLEENKITKKEANEILLLKFHQHGRLDLTCKQSIVTLVVDQQTLRSWITVIRLVLAHG